MKQLPKLYVEGKNDLYVVSNLMKARGVELDLSKGPVVIESRNSYVELLDSLKVATKADLHRCGAVGFVFDTDREEDRRFAQISDRLSALGYALSADEISSDGIVKQTPAGKIGVWMMPHVGARSGKLEDFLRALVPDGDAILPLANRYVGAVADGVEPSCRYRDIDREKAQMASWLAVQPNPGLPYGSAITAKLLNPQAPLAQKFVDWMCRVYDLSIVGAEAGGRIG